MKSKILDMKEYANKARQMAAEGCVLLKNDEQALPLRHRDRIAVFGRCALHYYKSGLGSGGLVNTSYVVSILDALKEQEELLVNQELIDIYKAWEKKNPIDQGQGWGTVPWSQKEMPVTAKMLSIAEASDAAIVIVGRTAGEDQDNRPDEGSYLLTKAEKDMIQKVSKANKRTIVLLNVGNIMDMKWVAECQPAAVLYVWQGGQEGGHGIVDVLTGKVSPCGKLTDTIAKDIRDYPSTAYFGQEYKNCYVEDIYVGYRYFETFAREKVLYPFGFGLSYTTFSMNSRIQQVTEESIFIETTVKNTGTYAGKEVVQIYVKAPQGMLGKPERVLAGFHKTKMLQPGESQILLTECPKKDFASFDETGESSQMAETSFVLEAGEYGVFAGSDVRSATAVGSWEQEFVIVEKCHEACAPVEDFQRMRRKDEMEGIPHYILENCPTRTKHNREEMVQSFRRDEIAYQGDCGYKLSDVAEEKITMEQFISQLSREDLAALFHGEGMCSSKVTPGTAGAFGGVTDELNAFGIPAACCADGPSGIRMDCGTIAFSLPNGTAIGCSMNQELAEELYALTGLEMVRNRVDTLLGPGINLHRNPLNGRNFEYCSEDPFLTGKMCAAQLKGLHKAGASGTIKHFCANNQEHYRARVDAIVSQRALRELYLKCFEIPVKEGKARAIMTSYNPLNGIWSSGNHDLCTVILREEWHFQGIVMTDWWAVANWEGEEPWKGNRAPMVMAQNDLFMVSADARQEMANDNVLTSLEEGKITLSDLQRNAGNILHFILKSQAMRRRMHQEEHIEVLNAVFDAENQNSMQEIQCIHIDEETGMHHVIRKPVEGKKGMEAVFQLEDMEYRKYEMKFEVKSDLNELAQLPVSVYIDNIYRTTLSFQGTAGQIRQLSYEVEPIYGSTHYLKLHFAADGIEIRTLKIIAG